MTETDREADAVRKAAVFFELNGAEVGSTCRGDTPLLYVLRDELGLNGPRVGCGAEQCGACIVLVDGATRYSCTLPVDSVAGCRVLTVEGLGSIDAPNLLQKAFIEEQAGQCGYCLSGILMAATALLETNPDPTDAEIREALDRNLCRCGAHNRIVRAVRRASVMMAEAAS